MCLRRRLLTVLLLPLIAMRSVRAAEPDAAARAMPQLRHVGAATQLYVADRPFLALGGELDNSTASDLDVLRTSFDTLQRMHLNTVMLPVYWDRIEPAEGAFDFALVQGAIEQARARDLHVVILWFGTWKNSMSCYAPGWVKRDVGRFARARRASGEAMEIVSPESRAARDADCNAFATLMRFVKRVDADRQTVVMIQVENEIGMIPEARDHSAEADRAFASAVPAALLAPLADGSIGPEVTSLWEKAGRRASGTWAEVFGADAAGEEVFAAWRFATYAEAVAAAGKREYALPMYANAALMRPGYAPGRYPSGGPLPHLLEVWRAGAPSIDMLSPDIYFPNFADWSRRYVRNGNPLFIPEMAPSARASANALYAIAGLGAIGIGPFAIETLAGDKATQLGDLYALLQPMAPLILAGQRDATILGLSPPIGFDWTFATPADQGTLGGIVFRAEFDVPASGDASTRATTLPTLGSGRWEVPPGTPLGAAMVLRLGPDEFVLVGKGVNVTFAPQDGKGHVGIDSVQEGRFADGGTRTGGRWLNGDETHQGRHVRFEANEWTAQRVKLYRYE